MFACDCFGGAWYRFGVAVPAADTALPSAWVRLEDMPEKEEGKSSSILFTKAAPFGSPSKTSGSDEASTAAPNVKQKLAGPIRGAESRTAHASACGA